MLSYYLRDVWRSWRRSPVLTALVALAIALGIGVSVTMLAVFTIMASNPIPEKSDVLFRVQVDSWGPLRPFDEDRPERAPIQWTWRDVQALLDAGKAPQQVGMFESGLVIDPEGEALPFEVSARVTSHGFFPMFEPPFLHGGGWDASADAAAEQVIVLSRAINERLFGGEDSVGRRIVANDRYFTVVGVLDDWAPMPRFYDVVNDPFREVEEVFVPLSLTPVMELPSYGSDWGWKPENVVTFEDWLNSESAWLQFWAELPTRTEQDAYLAHLDAYVLAQKQLGRFERPLNNHIHDVMAWMDYNEVVERDVSVLVGLGFLFLVVCLLSSIALLLTRFEGRTAEMSLRRALGATRAQIVNQNLLEVALLGAVGGAFGIGLCFAGLAWLRAMISRAPDALFALDWSMVLTALAIAVAASLAAAVYPALRVTRLSPAQQLKTQ
ncbi:MAG: ABC transporter permease [Pseudomonadales bacterium]|nr:ABC transporter permease [Pseudomonadales bacterium]